MTTPLAEKTTVTGSVATPGGGPIAGPPVISIASVTKSYGGDAVVNDVRLEIERGEIFGLIGPSGCGKTTLLRLLVGLLVPTEGEIRVNGKAPAVMKPRDRQAIGYMPQGFALYENLSVEDNARFVAAIYGLGWWERRRRVREVLQFLELWPARRRSASDVSGGMQRRLALACAVLHRPHVLFIDEPTAGLDPLLRAKVWDYLETLRCNGTTVFVTTQYIDEASRCQRVAIMREGRIIATGQPDELRAQAKNGEAVEIVAAGLESQHIRALWSAPGVRRVYWEGGDRVRLVADDSATASAAASQLLHDAGVEVQEVRAYVPTFEDVFMALIQREQRSTP